MQQGAPGCVLTSQVAAGDGVSRLLHWSRRGKADWHFLQVMGSGHCETTAGPRVRLALGSGCP